MPLRRKPATRSLGKALTLRANLPVYPKRDITADYLILATDGPTSVCEHRRHLTRQLVMIQEVKSMSLREFGRLAQAAHENIARPLALYGDGDRLSLVSEFLEMNILDIRPLAHEEVAAAMAQVTAGIRSLFQQRIFFLIASVRVSQHGTAKIVLDWDQEPIADPLLYDANKEYVAHYVDELMGQLGIGLSGWTKNASGFRNKLKEGHLPESNVSPDNLRPTQS
ncbi:ATP-dependent DNA helicase PIF1 [Purpureocillium lavendulum]|uniref:ATP-dependent DNA helicase PIF1 n=1 Tax=Purpureocillium lavendulum TaxID=1247861 RepID=A0AB34FD41_9HYPO|nr:ATP-dependent DNA helicase PIF1 [Purpureocillium lavendulum]